MSQLPSLLPHIDGPRGLLVPLWNSSLVLRKRVPHRRRGGSWCSQPPIPDAKADRTEGICLDLTQTNSTAQVRLGRHSCFIYPTCKLFLLLHPHRHVIMIAQLINSLKELWDIQMEEKVGFLYFCFSKVTCINTEFYKSFAEDEVLPPAYGWVS